MALPLTDITTDVEAAADSQVGSGAAISGLLHYLGGANVDKPDDVKGRLAECWAAIPTIAASIATLTQPA